MVKLVVTRRRKTSFTRLNNIIDNYTTSSINNQPNALPVGGKLFQGVLIYIFSCLLIKIQVYFYEKEMFSLKTIVILHFHNNVIIKNCVTFTNNILFILNRYYNTSVCVIIIIRLSIVLKSNT